MRILYSAILYLLIPFIFLRLLIRGLRVPAHWQRIAERFAIGIRPLSTEKVIWIHAVSVGEVSATQPIVAQLLKCYPDYQLLITTTTVTGAQTVRRYYGDQVVHYYLAYDLPDAMHRFVDRIRPSILVVMETEIWPNLFYAVHRRAIPLLLVNARMSEKSARGYARLGRFMRDTIGMIDQVAAQTDEDARRLIRLGVVKDRITITGNLKFDICPSQDMMHAGRLLRQRCGADRPVWIAASIHKGEEEIVLAAFRQIRAVVTDALLIIVPRHIERADKIAKRCYKQGYSYISRSRCRSNPVDAAVYILDTLNELLLHYLAADVAFVGGSLVPVGGHNVLEPAGVGVPVLVGPYTHNFLEINRQLQARRVVRVASDANELAQQVITLLTDTALRRELGEQGRLYIQQNQGAMARLHPLFASYLG